MAQNRQVELDAEDSSSSDEKGSSEGSESEEEEEDKTSPPTPPVTKKPSASKKPDGNRTHAVPKPSSSDDSVSESDSDADSDLPPGKVDPGIKPIASKPITQRARSKPGVPTSPPPAKSASGVKRPVESEAADSKRAKRKVVDEESKKTSVDDPKKQLFQRLWSEDDEIVILKGMMDYRAKKGADPVADMNAFHDFIKKSLHVDVSKTQLSDKVRRLKKKYENNAVKEKKGNDRTLTKPHEQKAYELSKKIWGKESSSIDNGTEKKNQTQKSVKAVASPRSERFSSPKKEVSKSDVPKLEVENKNVAPSQSVQLSTSTIEAPLGVERLIKDRLDLIEGSKKTELDEKWKQLHLEEIELYLKRVNLIQEQTKLVLESFKSAEN